MTAMPSGLHVLLVTHYFHPEVGAPQSRLHDLAEGLSRCGHSVTVLTGLPNYPDGVIPPAYRGRWFAVERLGRLRIVRAPVYPAPNRGVARRLLNHASFAASAIPASLRTGRADVVIVETPPLFTALAGVVVSRLKRARLLLNVADLWTDAAIEMGVLRSRAVIATARGLERFAYRQAALIAVPTPGLERVLRERGYPAARILVVPHGVDPARFPLDPGTRPVPRRVVYCGTIGLGHATATLVDAARLLEEAGGGYEFLIVGDGAERAEVEARARRLELRSVTFAGRIPRTELPRLLASAHVGVATQRDLPLLADALSTKVLEYMAAARPVVAAASGWTAEVVRRAGAGIVCPPEDPAALAAAIAEVGGDADRARAMGLSGRRYVEANLTRTIAIERLADALASPALTGRGRRSPVGAPCSGSRDGAGASRRA
jgi:glycosyltransferase involved in cell wall biosynthesis